jgi:hypothetical protein
VTFTRGFPLRPDSGKVILGDETGLSNGIELLKLFRHRLVRKRSELSLRTEDNVRTGIRNIVDGKRFTTLTFRALNGIW